jgi:AAA domain
MSHLDLDLAERASVAVTFEAVSSLVDFYTTCDSIGFSPPLVLGRDIYRQLGERDGFGIWRELMFEYEPRLREEELLGPSDPRTVMTSEQYNAALIEQWRDYGQGEMHWTEMLLVDAMAEARAKGWKIAEDMFFMDDLDAEIPNPTPVRIATEAILDDLARRSGAKRATVEADRSAAEKARDARIDKFIDLDDDAYENWIKIGAPDGRGLKFARWKERRLSEDAAIARYDTRCAQQMSGMPMPAALLRVVPSAPLPDLLVSSADFIAGFVPPEYLIDGIVQRRYFYSMTAQTGVGKTSIAMRWMAHVVTGRPIGDKEVQQGSVLYFAGENPDDVRARWLVLTRDMGIDPDTKKVTWIVGAKDLNATAQQISAEVAAKGLNLAYVVIDTAAAYNVGDDENSNTQAGNYARQLRSLTNLPGGPCVVVLCHPTKRAADDDLMPRGGGAFLAEVDGNMAVLKKDSLLVVTPFGKFRGDTSWSQRYEIEVIKDHPKLKDARGRQMNSVVARPVGDGAAAIMEKRTDADTETVLNAVHSTPSATPTDLARVLGWTFGSKADPNVNRVKRNLARLLKDKLVRETLGKWRATEAGQRELNAIDAAKAASLATRPMPPLPPTFGLPR